MSLQPGEPPAGAGTEATAEAAREVDDPGGLQVDLDDTEEGDGAETVDEASLPPGIHETDKAG